MKSYQISRDGQMLGEFVEPQIQEGLKTGYFLSTDWCWAEGMTDWMSLGGFLQQAAVIQLPNLSPEPVNPYAPPQSAVVSPAVSVRSKQFFQPASRGARFGANFLDNLAVGACAIPFAFMSESQEITENDMQSLMVGGGLLLLLVLANAAFIAMNGQTIGKRIVGIRTARMDDGSKAGFFRIVFLRFFIAQGLLGLIPLWGLIDTLWIFGDEHRCLHDKIAGTQVLDT